MSQRSYVANDVVKQINLSPISSVKAIGYIDYFGTDKQNQKEFERKVQEIVEDCVIMGVLISC